MGTIGGPEQEKDPLALTKADSLDLTHLGLAGRGGTDTSMNLNELKMTPGTWNENQGVIIYADNQGKKFAVPGSERARREFVSMGMMKDESVGVPHLNDAEVWGSEERREGMETFHHWKELAEKEQARQQAEAAADTAAAREVFGGGDPEKK